MDGYEQTCLGCIPLKAGVFGIALLQFGNAVVRLIPGLNLEDNEGLYYYVAIVMHSISIVAACLLMLGLAMKSHRLLVPWMFLSLFGPVSFFLNMFINILFFNVVGVAYLLVVSGLPSLVTLYFIYCVYCLYKEMFLEDQLTIAAQQAAEAAPVGTLYGTSGRGGHSNVVFVTELESGSSSVSGGLRADDPPPSYDELVSAQKAHVNS